MELNDELIVPVQRHRSRESQEDKTVQRKIPEAEIMLVCLRNIFLM